MSSRQLQRNLHFFTFFLIAQPDSISLDQYSILGPWKLGPTKQPKSRSYFFGPFLQPPGVPISWLWPSKEIQFQKKTFLNSFFFLFLKISGKLPAAMQTAGGRNKLSRVLAVVVLLLSNVVRLFHVGGVGGARMWWTFFLLENFRTISSLQIEQLLLPLKWNFFIVWIKSGPSIFSGLETAGIDCDFGFSWWRNKRVVDSMQPDSNRKKTVQDNLFVFIFPPKTKHNRKSFCFENLNRWREEEKLCCFREDKMKLKRLPR